MNQLFIKTKDLDTKNKLLEAGFELISKEDVYWVFLNQGESLYEINKKEIVLTDSLYV